MTLSKLYAARLTLASLAALCAAPPALADYKDDRSTPQSLIESLYNALESHEYARAWSYFAEKPSASFDAYEAGFANTGSVSVITGTPEADAGAGTTRWQVPVAIKSVDSNGAESVFAGCYTIRLTAPSVQGDPYTPMEIVATSINSAQGDLDAALPAYCDPQLASPTPPDPMQALAKTLFAATMKGKCDDEQLIADPEIHELSFRYAYEGENDPQRQAKLYHFICRVAAYNVVDVYFQWDESEGLRQIQFAEPELDIRYKDAENTKLDSMTITGFKVASELMNSGYDENDYAIVSSSKWRGVGDAWSSGKWLFRDGYFTLVRFEVDPTYDGEEEGIVVVDYDSAP